MPKYKNIVALDLETTGFSTSKHSILEIAGIKQNVQTGDKTFFKSLVEVKEIPENITLLTGISLSTLEEEGCSSLKKVLIDFSEFAEIKSRKTLFIGHNLLAFDNRFLNYGFKKYRLPLINPALCWDTMQKMRKEIKGDIGKRKIKVNLQAACNYYRVPCTEAFHRATADAFYTYQIYLKQSRRERLRATK